MIGSILVMVFWITLITVFLAYLDARKIIKDVIITKARKVIRGGCMLLIGYMFGSIMHNVYYTKIIITMLFSQTLYWTIFDASLNLFRGKSLLYTSNNHRDDNDSITDKAFNWTRHSGVLQITVKGLILLFTLMFM